MYTTLIIWLAASLLAAVAACVILHLRCDRIERRNAAIQIRNDALEYDIAGSDHREAGLRERIDALERELRNVKLVQSLVNEGPPAAGSILNPMYGAQS